MKTNFLIAFVLLSVSFIACKKNTTTETTKDQINTQAILTGVQPDNQNSEKPYISPLSVYWTISHSMYDNADVTGSFKGFRFQFLPDQTVVVSNKLNSALIYGKWYMPDSYHLIMYYNTFTFPYDIKFEQFLNGEWTILKSSYFGIYMESNENKIHRELAFERSF